MEKDRATEEWLNSQIKTTKATYKTLWRYFLEFTGLTGDEILESRKADKMYSWEKRVLQFKNWITATKGLSEYTATTAAQVVRGFFSFYRLTLKFRRTESARIRKAKRKTEDYRFSVDDLKRMTDVADLKEKYVIVAGKSFGLRAGDFLKLTRGDLDPYINREVPISIGEYGTQKEGVSAFPFIDSDAKPVIKLMLQNMNREGRTKPNDRMRPFKDSIQLTRVVKRVAERAGIETGTKTVRFHCMRKFLIDHLSSYMSESKWKQIVGKQISEGAYVSPDTLRSDYERAMVETCFSKRIAGEDLQKMAKVEALRAMAKHMGIKGTITIKARKLKSIDDEINELEKLLENAKSENEDPNDCANGEHCAEAFKEINEAELLSHLQAGWKIEYKTQNGNVIIRKG
ncbi:hypothetical protein E3J74_03535 [Candidatus Bathyarchaeota archaeon]|nr:MAG: hypothetical protein E3J74_03535 [Candidatus Bathyarchaeota archaeon]